MLLGWAVVPGEAARRAGGMPDLLLWCPAQGKAKLSEVKGPRDSLSSQQRAWIAAMLAGGLDCEVCARTMHPGVQGLP